jgi:fatty acid desaturase
MSFDPKYGYQQAVGKAKTAWTVTRWLIAIGIAIAVCITGWWGSGKLKHVDWSKVDRNAVSNQWVSVEITVMIAVVVLGLIVGIAITMKENK